MNQNVPVFKDKHLREESGEDAHKAGCPTQCQECLPKDRLRDTWEDRRKPCRSTRPRERLPEGGEALRYLDTELYSVALACRH